MSEVKWPNKAPMKIGERRQTITFKLGKLKVAEIHYCLSFGVSYIPKFKQNEQESCWLSYMDKDPETAQFKTIDQATAKLKELCGWGFDSLVRLDGKVHDDIETKEVSPMVWGSCEP
jgi:hypothetical protein